MAVIPFETPPSISLWTVFTHRGHLAEGATIPRIEASAARLVPDAVAYAKVCGFPLADPLPVTYPSVLARGLQLAVMTAPAFPLRLMGVVHTRQHITQLRAIRADEPLAGRCFVEGHRVVRGGGEFDLHTHVSAGGEPVWHGVTTILTRAIRGDGEKRPKPPEVPFQATRSVRWRLPADLGRRYAAVSGDWNPIHLTPLTARPFGFKRPIAHGWWTLARALAEMDTDIPEACTIEARFLAPVPLPGAVSFVSGPVAEGQRFEVRGRELAVVGEVGRV